MASFLPRLQRLIAITDQEGHPSTSFHIWWDNFATAIENSISDLTGVVSDLAAAVLAIQQMNDPNILTPVEKTQWIFMYAALIAEQADIDSKATSYGVTTEKTNYDNAVSALTTYLGTLTTPVAWNDTTGNTTIVGTTFQSKFNDVLLKKQLLLNKFHISAKTLADAAQTTANTGVTNAATAQTTANTGVTNAATAQTSANAAQTTANTGVTNAATAQTTADTVKRDDSISTSWASPGVILSASDAGSNATITISTHTRKYTDVSSVSVTGNTITGLAYSTQYFVYYDQTSRAGGGVTYHATTDPNVAMPGAAAGRHLCGDVTTPAAAGAPTSGGTDAPSGGGSIPRGIIP